MRIIERRTMFQLDIILFKIEEILILRDQFSTLILLFDGSNIIIPSAPVVHLDVGQHRSLLAWDFILDLLDEIEHFQVGLVRQRWYLRVLVLIVTLLYLVVLYRR